MDFNLKKYILIFFISLSISQETIGPGLSGDVLIDYVVNNYKSSNIENYENSRNVMYGYIDNDNGTVQGVYTQISVNNVPECSSASSQCDLVRQFINLDNTLNCEHVWPQSLYSGSEPMKSDMHHLRPCKDNVNSSRGNKPFGEISDWQTDNWYWQSFKFGF